MGGAISFTQSAFVHDRVFRLSKAPTLLYGHKQMCERGHAIRANNYMYIVDIIKKNRNQ